MKRLKELFPDVHELNFLGRFYWSSFVSELFNFALPFQFIFLFLVMDKPEWATLPLLVESVVVFFLEIPTGMVADRWGRRTSVVLGDTLSGFAWLMVPFAATLHGLPQVGLMCLAFAIEGIGQTLVSGAEEAWVVDNLIAKDKEHLAENYFSREKSLSSLAGIFSGATIWLVLLFSHVTNQLIGFLWYLAALGQFFSAFIQSTIPEYRIAVSEQDDDDENKAPIGGMLSQFKFGINTIFRIKPLFVFTLVMLVVTFSTGVLGDAFEISLIGAGMNPRELAPLALATDIMGFITPLAALLLARKYGRFRVLTWLQIIPAVVILAVFVNPGVAGLLILFLLFNLFDDLWDPIADVTLQSFIPSSNRATIGSIINQFSELSGMISLVVFTILLGKHSEAIRESVPDLVEAFSGEVSESMALPMSLFGLNVANAALVFFVFSGLIAAVLLFIFPWNQTIRGEVSEEKDVEKTLKVDLSENQGLRKRLVATKDSLDNLLDHYNPKEQLTWWVADDAFKIPKSTISQLKKAGPAMTDFFRAANKIYQTEKWLEDRLEKKFSPNYHLLNKAQPEALPRLIRPDVVCDKNWNPKLVELEITVCARADTSVMAKQYHLDPDNGLIKAYARLAKNLERQGKNLALITAPHPFFQDLGDDANSFANMLREQGVSNIYVLGENNLGSLVFDGKVLTFRDGFNEVTPLHFVDRFIDIYEIAELQHPGMAALLEAYLAGAIEDINTFKQFLDEKDWMSLFWERRLASYWKSELSSEHYETLRAMIPRTWTITEDLKIKVGPSGQKETISISELPDIKSTYRQFVIKESGTSTTSSGSQSFYVLHQMERDDLNDLISDILSSGVEFVLQELVESRRIEFDAIDPESDKVVHQKNARVKLSPFYIDGELTDIRMVASNVKYAVNDRDCVVGVVRY